MATYLQNLQTAQANIGQALANMTANPQPNYSIDGQSFSWQGLFDSYMSQLEQLNAQIALAGGPFEISTKGTS